jgi:hypothetical protein
MCVRACILRGLTPHFQRVMKIEAESYTHRHPSKMATHVEHQMESCLSEMERLRGELQRLQTVKAEQETAELEKTTSPEPNMGFMDDWLTKSKENEEFIEEICSLGVGGLTHFERGSDESRKAQAYTEGRSVQKNEICKFPNGGMPHGGRGQNHKTWMANGGRTQPRSEQEFMMNFVEATHNLFRIQQSRIDQLETKLNLVQPSRIDQLETKLKLFTSRTTVLRATAYK